jgi:hypothetical protein
VAGGTPATATRLGRCLTDQDLKIANRKTLSVLLNSFQPASNTHPASMRYGNFMLQLIAFKEYACLRMGHGGLCCFILVG